MNLMNSLTMLIFINFIYTEIENEQALLDFAQKFYDDILSGSGNDMVSAVQRLVNACVHFFKSKKMAESPSAEVCQKYDCKVVDSCQL